MDLEVARLRMVEGQIAARGVRDARVLDAMRIVPRHLFVRDDLRDDAYADRPLPIGEGQTISQPFMVALMTATLAPRERDRVLEVGTGSGYQTAVLATLAREVISIERHASLAAGAMEIFEALRLPNVHVIVADGTQGWPAGAPYDRILVTAGALAVPETLKSQLADGGRLVIPVGPPAHQHLMRIDRRGDVCTVSEGEGCVFVPLVGRHGW